MRRVLSFYFFFFSSRRRHTRWPRDWSSDVCSSDLIVLLYSGDVLTTYAVICLVLLAMHRVRDRTALLTSAIIYAFVTLSLIVSAAFLDRSKIGRAHV